MSIWEGLVNYLLVVLFTESASLIRTSFENDVTNIDPGKPLFLTPYLNSGDVEKARVLSEVGIIPRTPNVESKSYSGFFTVNKKYSSNIFFWFFPAVNGDVKAPVILWLQGGPGSTGLIGLFLEHGPYFVRSDLSAGIREYHWAKHFQIIYVDNPVGAGFSFTEDDEGYATDQNQVADDLYEFLQQFFTLFYDYADNEFYIAGESYGGKYVPSLAYKIHTTPTSRINFRGMAIGNGWSDPENMLDYSSYLYQLGLIDRKQASYMNNASQAIVQLIRSHRYYEAAMEHIELILRNTSYFWKTTGFENVYNLLRTEDPEDFSHFRRYLLLPGVRKAIHVGNATFQTRTMMLAYLLEDFMKSVKPYVSAIMDAGYKVMFYGGQLDLVVPHPATVNFLHTVDWKHAEEYRNAERLVWRLSGSDQIAGYVHNVGDYFYEVLVRNAGHQVPYDQPKVALDLITRFIRGQPFE